jgi:hypothetical protein
LSPRAAARLLAALRVHSERREREREREKEADECGAIGHLRASARVVANHGPLIQISGGD